MGLRGPRSKFIDAACPNERCRNYNKAGQVLSLPMEVTPPRVGRFINSSAANVGVYFVDARGRLSMIFDLRKRK